MSKVYVLDANSVLNFLEEGPGAMRMEQLFQEVRDGSTALMSVVNWGEVFYHSWQKHGEQSAHSALSALARLSIEVVTVDKLQILRAAEIKVVHKIPYVDSIAAALAVLRHATLVTSDRDFEKLGRQFPVLWINR